MSEPEHSVELVCDYRPAEAAIELWRCIVGRLENPAQVQAGKLYMDLPSRFRVDANVNFAARTTQIPVVARPTDAFLVLMAAVAAGDIDHYIADLHGGSL